MKKPTFNSGITVTDNLNPDSPYSKRISLIPDIESVGLIRIKGTLYITNE